jgi:hypothetical protein
VNEAVPSHETCAERHSRARVTGRHDARVIAHSPRGKSFLGQKQLMRGRLVSSLSTVLLPQERMHARAAFSRLVRGGWGSGRLGFLAANRTNAGHCPLRADNCECTSSLAQGIVRVTQTPGSHYQPLWAVGHCQTQPGGLVSKHHVVMYSNRQPPTSIHESQPHNLHSACK